MELTELKDKQRRAQDNLGTMEAAEQQLKQEQQVLLKKLEARVSTQGNTEKFISDQIMEKVGIVTQLEKKLDDMSSSKVSKMARHRKTVDKNRALNKEVISILKNEINEREESLLRDSKKKTLRDSLKTQETKLHRQQTDSRSAAQAAFREYEDARAKEITRLTGKERLKNQGLIQVYKEHLERMNDQAGTKAQQDYCENMAKIQKVGQATINTLALNEKLDRQHQELQRELAIHRYTVKEAQQQNRRLQAVLENTVRQFWASESKLENERAYVLSNRVDEKTDVHNAQEELQRSQGAAQVCRKELRDALKECEELRAENQSVKDDAAAMFNGNSISWAITTALPAIWNGSKSDSRPDGAKAAHNEEELELLLSALRVALIHEEFTHALGTASKQSPGPPNRLTTEVSSSYSLDSTTMR